MKVGIVDFGVGNLGSVARALEGLRVTPSLVTRALDLHANDCLVLPGVGNFTTCMQMLTQGGWASALQEEVLVYQRPLLGICLGMQLLADSSTEGASDLQSGTPGLGLIPGRVEHLARLGCSQRVPHVGWNSITTTDAGGHLFHSIPDGTDFYFVHSYTFLPEDESDVLARAAYDIPVVAAVGRGHVWGTQFHPEKSSRAGFQLLRNFLSSPAC